jgi:diadenosine tetraphosphate (Ap4A) HIT family hydrolase
MVNHYQNMQEGFLGWLVAQPVNHRMTFSDLTTGELEEFGVAMERLEKALTRAYDTMFPDDPVEIVYLVRLGESTLARPAEWHVHCHMLPRTASMRKKCEGWEIQKCRERGVKPEPSRLEIEELMTGIRLHLADQN